ncbi:MAG: HlyD family efflux transporter periplasmic adaptor subunit [Bacteroidales bacterium]|nr:HlyD family efflux transporter periplasmic adaptor subunit [Bacteroidales bacterium]
MKKLLISMFAFYYLYTFTGCKSHSTEIQETIPKVTVEARPLVKGSIQNEIYFNGTTVFLKRNPVIAPISGYVAKARVVFGQEVGKNDVLFELKTKEAQALESDKDTFNLAGIVKVPANSDGYIAEINLNEAGAYVTEGSVLCTIVNDNDLFIRLNVPIESMPVVRKQEKCKIIRSENSVIAGTVFRILPSVDVVNQTQTVFIKPAAGTRLPENMNLLLSFVNEQHSDALLVSRSSLMTNETQSTFWVMKIVNDSIAVKVPVRKGLENDSIVEIISPELHVGDVIINKGAYALPDSSIVNIAK